MKKIQTISDIENIKADEFQFFQLLSHLELVIRCNKQPF